MSFEPKTILEIAIDVVVAITLLSILVTILNELVTRIISLRRILLKYFYLRRMLEENQLIT